MYTIKNLEWEDYKNRDGTICIRARGVDRFYEVDNNGPIKVFVKSFHDYIYKDMSHTFDKVKDAKEFAQDHFNDRVLQYLNVPNNSENGD